MLIVHAIITLDLPYIHSLKGRRAVVNAIKERLKHKNMAVADVSGEYAKEAQLEIVFFASNENEANNKIHNIENLLEQKFSDILYNISYEII